MKKQIKILVIVIAVISLLVAGYFIFAGDDVSEDITVFPERGDFVMSVTVAGELRAENSVDIRCPGDVRSLGIYRMTISDLIEEGTVVKKGDYVAELDKTPIMTKLKEIELSVLKYQSQYEQTQIDTTLTLSKSRDNLENLKFAMEEQKLKLEQSQYEPPAVIKQAEINLERAKRQYKQAVKNYKSEKQKAITNMTIVGADLSREKQKMARLQETAALFTVLAPADGMVVYKREWNGKKLVVGDQISAWDPTVARLPDLTKMQSVVYINEIDISKIEKGQKVKIRPDAAPEKELKGIVVSAANIGEDLRGSDSKVFETVIDVIDKDTTLKPAMTTSNEIITKVIEDVLFIPQECLHTYEDDSTKYHYVFVKKRYGIERREVVPGQFNDNDVIIEKGLTEADKLLMTIPENPEEIDLLRLSEYEEAAKLQKINNEEKQESQG